MESEILEWITNALAKAKSKAMPLPSSEAADIVITAKDLFVIGNPRAWWMSLEGKPQLFDSKKNKLEDILPCKEDRYWFIPETEQDDLRVFDLTLPEIVKVLNDCPFFEFYVVDKKYRWLVAESDHNQFHVLFAESKTG